jgi:hypothetical protein
MTTDENDDLPDFLKSYENFAAHLDAEFEDMKSTELSFRGLRDQFSGFSLVAAERVVFRFIDRSRRSGCVVVPELDVGRR